MRKDELNEVVEKLRTQIKDTLQIVYDALNQGQQKQIVKNEAVKEIFDRYGVEYSE